MNCASCGAPLGPNSKFCTICGTPVQAAPVIPEPVAAPVAEPKEEPIVIPVVEPEADPMAEKRAAKLEAPIIQPVAPPVKPVAPPVPPVQPAQPVRPVAAPPVQPVIPPIPADPAKILPKQYRPVGAWGYFGLQILYSIPVIGFIFLIVFSLSDGNINRRNHARSYWCGLIIYLVLVIALIVLVLVTGLGAEILSEMESLL